MQYLSPTQLLELEDVSDFFRNPREIGQVFAIFNRYNNNILDGYRTKNGVRIEKKSFVDFISHLKKIPKLKKFDS